MGCANIHLQIEQCTALHCTAPRHAPPHCTALHCAALQSKTMPNVSPCPHLLEPPLQPGVLLDELPELVHAGAAQAAHLTPGVAGEVVDRCRWKRQGRAGMQQQCRLVQPRQRASPLGGGRRRVKSSTRGECKAVKACTAAQACTAGAQSSTGVPSRHRCAQQVYKASHIV